MKAKAFLFVLGFVLALGCDKSEDIPPFENVELETAEAKALVSQNNQFAIEFFRKVVENETEENYMVSPLSLSMALGMVHNGAHGDTKVAFDNLLGMGAPLDQLNQFNENLRKSLTTKVEGTDMNLANAIWIQEDFPVEDTFVEVNQKVYEAEVDNIDFRNPAATTIVNNWVERNTNGKIRELVKEFTPGTRLFLANALYFKSQWKYRFKTENTRNALFYSSPENAVEVPMMNMNAEVPFFVNETFRSIILPYKKERFEMLLLLPNYGLTTSDIMDIITGDNLDTWLKEYDLAELAIGVPKFEMEYENLLNDELKDLGLEIAFSANADLGGISPGASLQISRVLQKTFIEVNEEGTEAAAATGVEVIETSAPPSFIADRPFLYLIRDGYTGSILFIGRIGLP
ncbi:serpin family protein [Flavobacteriaceae bacterium GF1]